MFVLLWHYTCGVRVILCLFVLGSSVNELWEAAVPFTTWRRERAPDVIELFPRPRDITQAGSSSSECIEARAYTSTVSINKITWLPRLTKESVLCAK